MLVNPPREEAHQQVPITNNPQHTKSGHAQVQQEPSSVQPHRPKDRVRGAVAGSPAEEGPREPREQVGRRQSNVVRQPNDAGRARGVVFVEEEERLDERQGGHPRVLEVHQREEGARGAECRPVEELLVQATNLTLV